VNRALRAATLGVLLFSPVALTACSAGQVTQTATQERDKTGAQAQVGDINLREVELAYPDLGYYNSGDDAQLRLAIANDGTSDDTLVGVSGDDFSGATFAASGSGASAAATGATSSSAAASTSAATSSGATSTGATSTGATSTSAVPTGSAPATGTAPATGSASATSSGPSELAIPAGQTVFVGQQDGNGPTITLNGLSRSLTTGQTIKITFSFQNAGDVTVEVTVANPSNPLTRQDGYNFGGVGGE
jgi:copper(I)-binding protein